MQDSKLKSEKIKVTKAKEKNQTTRFHDALFQLADEKQTPA